MHFIAEIGWNFIGDMELAEEMVKQAASAGANTAKFQLWDPRWLKDGAWDHDGRREIYEKAALNDDRLKLLLEACSKYDLEFLTSVFETRSLERVRHYGCRAIKIPSHECVNFDLIDEALESFELVYLSIGAVTASEFDAIVQRYSGNPRMLPMHCLSSYPAEASHLNLRRIEILKSLFGVVGYSSHYSGSEDVGMALALGATVVEKHFTTSNDLPGRDNKFALNTDAYKAMVSHTNLCESFMEWRGLGLQPSEHDVHFNMRGRWDR